MTNNLTINETLENSKKTSTTQIENVLDRSLKIALKKQRRGEHSDFPNVLITSDAGFGKTDMVRQWAKKNNINLICLNLGTMGTEAFGGIIARDSDDPRYATRLGTNEMIKAFNKPNSVLFLDEYNRSKTEIRGAVLTLVQNHMVWDPTAENNERYLDNFLFTIAAINPCSIAYKGAKEMDPAELSRFYSLEIIPDPKEHLKYLTDVYNNEIENSTDETEIFELKNKLALCTALLKDPRFAYDTAEDIENNLEDDSYRPLNYRSLKMAIDRCDGSKEDFLDIWSHYCNPEKKTVIEDILYNYVDIDDKATSAISMSSNSRVFEREMSVREKLRKSGFAV